MIGVLIVKWMLCDKMGEAEDAISNEIKKLEDFKKVIESGIIKNAEVLKKQIDNQIEQFKKIKKR